jgi:hypothetical protein
MLSAMLTAEVDRSVAGGTVCRVDVVVVKVDELQVAARRIGE